MRNYAAILVWIKGITVLHFLSFWWLGENNIIEEKEVDHVLERVKKKRTEKRILHDQPDPSLEPVTCSQDVPTNSQNIQLEGDLVLKVYQAQRVLMLAKKWTTNYNLACYIPLFLCFLPYILSSSHFLYLSIDPKRNRNNYGGETLLKNRKTMSLSYSLHSNETNSR